LLKLTYKPKLKNEVALKKYIKNADKKQPSGSGGSNSIKHDSIKRNDILKY
tara:strand:+ start:489 stop:641 length:153 start_codon:yes stop_codon:yes gene_type:complete